MVGPAYAGLNLKWELMHRTGRQMINRVGEERRKAQDVGRRAQAVVAIIELRLRSGVVVTLSTHDPFLEGLSR